MPVDDKERIENIKQYTSQQFDADFITSIVAASSRQRRLSPPAFRFQLTELARQAKNVSSYLRVMSLVP